jgi:four helix bundle protein
LAEGQTVGEGGSRGIAEGFERRNARYFGQFLSYARGSCAELRAQLYLASDVGWLVESEFSRLSLLAAEVARMLGALYESQLASRKLYG